MTTKIKFTKMHGAGNDYTQKTCFTKINKQGLKR